MIASANRLRPVRTPARPGPGPTPGGLLRQLELTVRRRIDNLLAGDYRAWAFGDGAELAQIRPYVLGDDVRRIDWNVTARVGEPHVRLHVAERAVETWLVLDTSASMTFGTADRRKWDVAEGVSIAVAHVASRRGNRLGVATFGDGAPTTSRPRQGSSAVLPLLFAVRREPDLEPRGATSIGASLERIARLARRRSFVVVVSDFRGPRDWRAQTVRLASRHEVVAIEVRDPREQVLPDLGHLWLADPETGHQLSVDTHSRRVRERFQAVAADDRDGLASELHSLGVGHVVLSTDSDWLKPLIRFLKVQGRQR